MKNQHETNSNIDDKTIGGLLSGVSPRPTPHSQRKEEIYNELVGDWRARLSARKRRHQVIFGSIAASIVIAVVLSLQVGLTPSSVGPEPDAMLARVVGSDATLNGRPIDEQTPRNSPLRFRPDDRLLTGPNAAVSIIWDTVGSLRLSSSSSLLFSDDSGVELLAGSLYYDSKSRDGRQSAAITIGTPYGKVHHVGTQFVATVKNDGIELSVREGEITFGEGSRSITLESGESAFINAALEPTYSTVGKTGGVWTWASLIAPPLNADGLSTSAIIDWLSKESGHFVVYDSSAAENFALHDSISGIGEIDPSSVIDIIELATELEFTVEADVVHVGLKRR